MPVTSEDGIDVEMSFYFGGTPSHHPFFFRFSTINEPSNGYTPMEPPPAGPWRPGISTPPSIPAMPMAARRWTGAVAGWDGRGGWIG